MNPANAIPLGFQLAARLRPVLSRLPPQPPALALAAALDHWLLPRLADDARRALTDRIVAIAVTDLGLTLRLKLDARGFGVAGDGPAALRVAADAPVYWRLVRGQDDADRLFFERALVMEGDTEMGLVLKNTLDAIGPLWT